VFRSVIHNGSNSSTVQPLQYKFNTKVLLCDIRSADRTTKSRIFYPAFSFIAFLAAPFI